MGWRGAVRSIGAAVRAAERDAQRRARAHERYLVAVQKANELQHAAEAVRAYQGYVSALVSAHRTGPTPIDWMARSREDAPTPPRPIHTAEAAARAALESYTPSLVDRALKRVERRRESLSNEVTAARERDASASRTAELAFQKALGEHFERRELAERLLAGDPEAVLEVAQEFNSFSDARALGTSLKLSAMPGLRMAAELQVHGAEIVPKQTLSLLASGRASTKAMPKGDYHRLYQDYVCSAVLRIARELFALTPINAVTVTATDMLLNKATGHLELQPILSVFIPRDSFRRLNLENIDPSDSLTNFVHRMDFRPTVGMRAIQPLDPEAM